MAVRGSMGMCEGGGEYGYGWKGQTTYLARLELAVVGWTSSRRPVYGAGVRGEYGWKGEYGCERGVWV